MRFLLIQHVPRESKSYVSDWIHARHHDAVTLKAWEVSDLADPTDFNAVIVLGGTMNVHDDFPFLAREIDFIRAYHRDVPILGICLGAQLIAHALGGAVEENAAGQEVGFGTVALTDAGRVHPLFNGFGQQFEVLQWHGYTFSLPERAEHLATSEICKHQAFTSGLTVGVQFHLEVTPELGREVYAEGGAWARTHPQFEEHHFLTGLVEKADRMRNQCFCMLDNFAAL